VPPRRRSTGRAAAGAGSEPHEPVASPFEALDLENLEGLADAPP
jgi:hypothetical protein